MNNLRIYLVQRGHIHKPYTDYKNKPLSKAVSLDYMGCAEFEFGALPKSLKFMKENFDRFEMAKWNGCNIPNKTVLRIWHPFNEELLQEYKGLLSMMFDDSLRLKTRSNFTRNTLLKGDADTDFWWDIQNHVMWSYDKWFMNHLPDVLQESFKLMD